MLPSLLVALALTLPVTPVTPVTQAAEAKLLRYPSYSQGRVAFTYLGDIWIAEENGRNARRLTVHPAREMNPRFSPDGSWIAFSSNRNGNNDVYVMPVAGGEPRQLTHHSAGDDALGWSPDGKAVVFSSNRGEEFTGNIYTVSVEGGMPRPVGIDYGVYGSFSPDGKLFAYNRRSQAYWRKHYRGSGSSDVTVMNVGAKTFTTLTDHPGLDAWPMFASDGKVYFVSDRDEGSQTNIWRVSPTGGAAEKVTRFTSGDVRWPSISADGRTIVFEHDFGISKLDVATGQVTPLRFELAGESPLAAREVRPVNSQADQYSLAPNGRRIVVATRGELFTAPVDDGELVQLTDSPWRDQNPHYSPDGRWVAFVSDQSGREEIWIVSADGAGAARKLTNVDALKNAIAWSPDSRSIAFTASDARLRVIPAAGGNATVLSTSKHGNIGTPSWSPDGNWIAFTQPDFTRTSDVWLVPASGGTARQVTTESYQESNPRFSPDGRKLYFTRNLSGRGGGGGGGGFGGANTQVMVTTLDREERDPADAAESAGRDTSAAPASRDTRIEWTGLKRRTRQFTRMPYGVQGFAVAPNGMLAVVTAEPSGARTVATIYTVSADGRRTTRVASAGAGGSDDNDSPAAGPGGAGISGLVFSRDNRALFYQSAGGVHTAAVSAPAAGTGAASTPATAARTGRRINFNARIMVDQRAEWAQMFGDAWRTMKYRFYDEGMHGRDWNALRTRYEPMLAHVGDRQEVINLINEMIGELDASHTGASAGPGGRTVNVQTRHLGVELEPDTRAGRYRVTHVYEAGPADHDWVRLAVGDYLLAIDGNNVRAGDEYYQHLNHPLNRKVELTVSRTGSTDGAWKTKVEPVNQGAFTTLRYERWVADRRAEVEKASNGRIGYVHIRGMNQPSLERFEKELRENRDKDALIIDQRWNGGGNIEQQLLALLVQRQYQVWQPRGTEETTRPLEGFFGPKVVLQNWRSGSNAEMFPAGFRALGLGKTIGEPTVGAVIGTGSYSLIDGSTVRTPGTGVYLFDGKRTNMENYGVPPDILVRETPEDVLAKRDRQLERAIEEMKKEIAEKKRVM
jgi:tricorn protease